jgi:hypothetical protein
MIGSRDFFNFSDDRPEPPPLFGFGAFFSLSLMTATLVLVAAHHAAFHLSLRRRAKVLVLRYLRHGSANLGVHLPVAEVIDLATDLDNLRDGQQSRNERADEPDKDDEPPPGSSLLSRVTMMSATDEIAQTATMVSATMSAALGCLFTRSP